MFLSERLDMTIGKGFWIGEMILDGYLQKEGKSTATVTFRAKLQRKDRASSCRFR